MGFPKASVRDAEVTGHRVLVRVDFNVPLEATARSPTTRGSGRRCRRSNCCASGAPRWCSASHLGRPGGKVDPELSLAPVGRRLAELLGVDVPRRREVVGDEVERRPAALGPGEVLLLENTRFEPGETKNDPSWPAALAALAELYVNDAFGAAHRAHASTEGVAHHLPGYAGPAAGARGDRADQGGRGPRSGRWWSCSAAPRSPTRSA